MTHVSSSGAAIIQNIVDLTANLDPKKPVDPNTIFILTPQAILALQALLGNAGNPSEGVLPQPVSGNPPPSSNDLFITAEDCSADIYAFLAAFQQLAQQMRNANREVRASEMNAQVNALLSSAEKLKASADLKLAAGIVQGAFQIGGGAMQIGMSTASAASSIKGAQLEERATSKAMQTAQEADPDQKVFLNDEAANLKMRSEVYKSDGGKLQGYSQAAGSVTTGLSGIIAASLTRLSDDAEIASKRKEAEARVHEQASSQANEMMAQMLDIIRDARNVLQAVDQSRQETTRTIIRNNV